jgi:hypothetical protein
VAAPGGTGHGPFGLADLTYRHGRLAWASRQSHETEDALAGYRAAADAAARSIMAVAAEVTPDDAARDAEADVEGLRWFPLPAEIARRLAALCSTAGAGL